MLSLHPLLAAAALSACCCAPGVAAAQAPQASESTEAPPRSTSDTLEYCDHLGRRFKAVAENRPGHPRAAVLAGEGRHLCRQGHARPGILRLRRALMLLDTPAEEPN